MDILILDEPTAVLTPQETEKLFTVLRNMREAGHSIIIITHKLHEVLSLSDRVSVLRKGAYIGTVQTKDATEASLTEMMVGKKVALNIERPETVNPQKRLVMEHVTCVDKEGVKTLDDAGLHLQRRDFRNCRNCRKRPERAAGGHCRASANGGRNHPVLSSGRTEKRPYPA